MKHSHKNKLIDLLVSGEEFSLVIDSEVPGMLKTTPRPSINDLWKYYDSDAYISHTDSRQSLMDKIYQRVKTYNANYKRKIISKHGHVGKFLDYGSGTGDFVERLTKHGIDAYAYEPNEKASSLAKNKLDGRLLSDSEVFTNKYDVICLWHVLEHIPNYTQILESLIEQLNPNGKLYIAVPNYTSFDASFYKKNWAAYDVPRHLWHFSPEAIRFIFKNFGMIIESKYPMYFDAFYISLMSEKYMGNKWGIVRAPMVGVLSNLLALKTGNYSSIIYQIGFK